MFSQVPKAPKEETSTTHKYWVRYNTLYIYWTKEDEDNENVEEVEPTLDATQASDYKYPNENRRS